MKKEPNGKWEDIWRKRKTEQQADWYLHFTAGKFLKGENLLNDQFQTLEVQVKKNMDTFQKVSAGLVSHHCFMGIYIGLINDLYSQFTNMLQM